MYPLLIHRYRVRVQQCFLDAVAYFLDAAMLIIALQMQAAMEAGRWYFMVPS